MKHYRHRKPVCFILRFTLKWARILSAVFICQTPLPCGARALELEELLSLDLVDLAQVKIEVASRKSESIAAAPSVISIITAREIEAFGANNLRALSRVC